MFLRELADGRHKTAGKFSRISIISLSKAY